MIGVVVWSCRAQASAVIWCDHDAGLAYLSGVQQFLDEGWPQPGDLVELDRQGGAGDLIAQQVRRVPQIGGEKAAAPSTVLAAVAALDPPRPAVTKARVEAARDCLRAAIPRPPLLSVG